MRLVAARGPDGPGRRRRSGTRLDGGRRCRARWPAPCAALGASEVAQERLDGQDWWFRCRFPGPDPASAPRRLGPRVRWAGHVADVWLNGDHLLRRSRCSPPHAVPVTALSDDNELCIRFAALTPVLERAPAPAPVEGQGGRQPEPALDPDHPARAAGRVGGRAGPGRAVAPGPAPAAEPVEVAVAPGGGPLRAPVPGGTTTGTVTVSVDVTGPAARRSGPVSAAADPVAGADGAARGRPGTGGSHRASRRGGASTGSSGGGPTPTAPSPGTRCGRWWPVGAVDLGEVGFRTVEAVARRRRRSPSW